MRRKNFAEINDMEVRSIEEMEEMEKQERIKRAIANFEHDVLRFSNYIKMKRKNK